MSKKIKIKINKISRLALALLFLFSGLFYFPVNIKALETDVKINEVMYAPTDGIEWVELFNAGADDVDLLDWVLTDEDGEYEYVFNVSVVFPAGAFLVIRSDAGTDELDFTDSVGTIYANHGSDYANTLDQVSLYNNSTLLDDTTIIDFTAWGGDAGTDDDTAVLAGLWTDGEFVPGVADGNSLGLIVDGDDSNVASDWQEYDSPTMGLSNEYVNQAPVIDNTWAEPDSVTADGASLVLLLVEVDDLDGLTDIAKVEIDLTQIGGADDGVMFDDGTNGDDIIADGVYSLEATVVVGTKAGKYQLPIYVEDSVGNSEVSELEIIVTAPVYSSAIRINEVLPNPSGAETTDEYVELYNSSSSSVNLAGWKISDASTSTYIIDPADFTSTLIPARGYFTIYRNISGIALNNSGDSVELYQPNDEMLDNVEYVGSVPDDTSYNFDNNIWKWSTTITPGSRNVITQPNEKPTADAGEDQSVVVGKIVMLDGTDSVDPNGDVFTCAWNLGNGSTKSGCNTTYVYNQAGEYQVTLTVSDGRGGEDTDTINIIVTTAVSVGPYSDKIIISEFLPNPEGLDNDTEFIEIYNSGSVSVNLSGWFIDDEDGGSNPYVIPDGKTIAGGGYLTFYRSDTSISINNTGDAVRILSPDEKVVSEARYEGSAQDNESYARNASNVFQWTTTLTPGKENIFSVPVEEEEEEKDVASAVSKTIPLLSISQARTKSKNTEIKVVGTVSVPPKILNDTYYYIQDNTGGIQIYFSKKDFPKLKLGDRIEIVGKISELSGEKKINIADIKDIKLVSSGVAPAGANLKTGDVKENFEGQLVSVSGQITKQSGNTLYINDGSGELKIYIQSQTGIDKPEWKKDDWVTITGIVGETTTGYRVMPRYQEDLRSGKNIFSDGNIPAVGVGSAWIYFVVLFGISCFPLLKRFRLINLY